ncbi:MAG: PfkB family carbohydrate kinase [Clostridia bacterium]|nr:PfkB family carbohydrate kinase [Clostridia bacterium]
MYDFKYDIVGIDMPCLDLNVSVGAFPKPNDYMRIDQYSWQGGGRVATGLVAAARLDAKCAIIGAVGDDFHGRFCVKDFERHGVDTQAFYVDPTAITPLSVVVSNRESNGRSILSHWGDTALPPLDDACRRMIEQAKYLFLAYTGKIHAEAARIAHAAGVKVLMDADDTSQAMMDLLPIIDVFIASEYFYKNRYTGTDYETHLRELIGLGPQIAVFTLGEKGCVGLGPEGYFELPAFAVDVVDTVGAGDVYHGAFAAALVQGMGAKEAARYASATAAIKCTRIGGRAGIPDNATVQQFLRDGTIDYTEIDRRVVFYQRGLEHV